MSRYARGVDLVIFAGPVIVKPAFREIPWRRPTEIVEVAGPSNTTLFSGLADSLRDSSGRVLPGLLRRYAHVERSEVDHLALCAWSAGWALLNRIFQVEADRREIDACVLSDAAFGTGLHGHALMAADAILGRCLMVATTTNNSANPALGIMKTGRETWLEINQEAIELAGGRGLRMRPARAESPLTPPSGGVWRTGSRLYWYDYTAPGSPRGTGNDYSHLEHHDMAPAAWTAYLVPDFAGPSRLVLIGAALAGAGIATGLGIYFYQ